MPSVLEDIDIVQTIVYAALLFIIGAIIACWRSRDDPITLQGLVRMIRDPASVPSTVQLAHRMSINVERLDVIAERLTPLSQQQRRLTPFTFNQEEEHKDGQPSTPQLRIEVGQSEQQISADTAMPTISTVPAVTSPTSSLAVPPSIPPLQHVSSTIAQAIQQVVQAVLVAWSGKSMRSIHALYSMACDVRDSAEAVLQRSDIVDGHTILSVSQTALTMLCTSLLRTIDPHLSSTEQAWVASAAGLVIREVIVLETRVLQEISTNGVFSCLSPTAAVTPPATTTVAVHPTTSLVYISPNNIPASTPTSSPTAPKSPKSPRSPSPRSLTLPAVLH